MFKRIARNVLHQDQWQSFILDEIEFPDGTRGTYGVVHRKPGVVTVVATPNKKILLQKEYRYVIDAYDWEVPGGGIDEAETEEQAARRELLEETGIHAQTLENLGTFYPLHSLNNEQVTIFYTVVNEDVELIDNSEESESFTERKFFTFDEVLAMIDRAEIIDAMTAQATQMVIRKMATL